jgi:hypothetical protein
MTIATAVTSITLNSIWTHAGAKSIWFWMYPAAFVSKMQQEMIRKRSYTHSLEFWNSVRHVYSMKLIKTAFNRAYRSKKRTQMQQIYVWCLHGLPQTYRQTHFISYDLHYSREYKISVSNIEGLLPRRKFINYCSREKLWCFEWLKL